MGNRQIGIPDNPPPHTHLGSDITSIVLNSDRWDGHEFDDYLDQPLKQTSSPTFGHLHISDLAAIYTNVESWVGPSDLDGIYFKNGKIGIGTTNPQGTLAGKTLQITTHGDTWPTLKLGREDGVLKTNGNYEFFLGSTGILTIRDSESLGQPILIEKGIILTCVLYIKKDGSVGIGTTNPTSKLQVVNLPVYANNAAAIAGGLTVGAFYKTGADPDPVSVVH